MLAARVHDACGGGEGDAVADGHEDRVGRCVGRSHARAPHRAAATHEREAVATAPQGAGGLCMDRITLQTVDHVQILGHADSWNVSQDAKMCRKPKLQ